MNKHCLYKSIYANLILPGIGLQGLGERVLIKAGEHIVVDSTKLNGPSAAVMVTHNDHEHLADRRLVLEAILPGF
jgi:hypothetical protein